MTYPNFCYYDMQDQGNKQIGGLTLPFDLPHQNDRPKSPEKRKTELQESLDRTKQDREAKTEQSKKERQQRQKQKERDKDGTICYSLLPHCLILGGCTSLVDACTLRCCTRCLLYVWTAYSIAQLRLAISVMLPKRAMHQCIS